MDELPSSSVSPTALPPAFPLSVQPLIPAPTLPSCLLLLHVHAMLILALPYPFFPPCFYCSISNLEVSSSLDHLVSIALQPLHLLTTLIPWYGLRHPRRNRSRVVATTAKPPPQSYRTCVPSIRLHLKLHRCMSEWNIPIPTLGMYIHTEVHQRLTDGLVRVFSAVSKRYLRLTLQAGMGLVSQRSDTAH
jgi:hypothetical protein